MRRRDPLKNVKPNIQMIWKHCALGAQRGRKTTRWERNEEERWRGENREMDGRGKTRNKGSRMREFALMCAGGSQRKMAVSRPFNLFSNLFPSGWFVPRVLLSSAPGAVCAPSCIPGGCVFACLCVGVLIDFENVRIEYWCTDGAERHVFTFLVFFFESHTLDAEYPEYPLPHVSLSPW